MSAGDRDLILSRLPDPPAEAAPPPGTLLATESVASWSRFEMELLKLGGRIVDLDESRAALRTGAVIDDDVAAVLGVGADDDVVWDADVGATTALCGVAETGSVLLEAGPGRNRMASLAPPLHIVFLRRSALVATLEDAFKAMTRRTAVLITGPSRTADIEGVLVRGVHGPRNLWVCPLDS
ncbi:MAG TPA: LUD domain-containing protein [Fimbriimonadaceae bacterium]|nr:LUD domain-containing protein [Fimbriimonadaceae bacterium]